MSVEDQVRQRIAMLRFLMIFGVVLLYVPAFVSSAELTSEPFPLFMAYPHLAVVRCMVPVLAVISGYLLFRCAIGVDPLRLAKKKSKTILGPFIFFNLALVAAALVLHDGLGLSLASGFAASDLRGWLDAAFGYRDSPIHYPLNFLRDLLVLMLLAPVYWLLAPCVVVGVLVLAYRELARYAPGLLGAVLGTRGAEERNTAPLPAAPLHQWAVDTVHI